MLQVFNVFMKDMDCGKDWLLWAAGAGRLEVCMWLVTDLGLEPASTRRKDGRTALHWAARNGHLDVVQYLVRQCGMDPDAPTFDGDTPFMLAVWQGWLPVARWLIEVVGGAPILTSATLTWRCCFI